MAAITLCALCLEQKPLTFEHIPPRRVFNDKPAIAHTINGLSLGSKYKKSPPVLQRPRGLGQTSLCEECNGRTASWYGDAFADWTIQCLRFAERVRGNSDVLLPFTIEPLSVLKQIVVMVFAASHNTWPTPLLNRLRYFVLNPHSMSWPNEFVVSAYLNPFDPTRAKNPVLTQNRLSGSCGILDVKSGTSVLVLSEIAFPPMGYVGYSIEKTEERRVSSDFASLCDLRGFANCHYGRKKTMFLSLPLPYPFGPVPGYYPDLNKPNGTKFLNDDHVVLSTKAS